MKKLKNILATFLFVTGFSFAIVNAQYNSMGIYIGNGSETYIPYNPYTGYGSNPNSSNNYGGGNTQVCPAIFPSPYACGNANFYCPQYGGYVTPSQCQTPQPPTTGTCIPPASVINYFADPGPNAVRCACPNGGGVQYNQRCPNTDPITCISYADDLAHTMECRSTCPTGYYISGSKCYHLTCPTGTTRRASDQYCITSTQAEFKITSPTTNSIFESGQSMTISWTPGYTISDIYLERNYLYTDYNSTNYTDSSNSSIKVNLPSSSSINSISVTLPINNSGQDLEYRVGIQPINGSYDSKVFKIKSKNNTICNPDQQYTRAVYPGTTVCTCPANTTFTDVTPSNLAGAQWFICKSNIVTDTCIKYADDLIHTKECRFTCPENSGYYESNNTCYYYVCPSGTTRRTSDNYCIKTENRTCPPNSIPYAIPALGDCVCANMYGAYVGVLVNYGGSCPTNGYGNLGTPKYCIDGTIVYGDTPCRDTRDNCQGSSWRWMWWRRCNNQYAY